MQHLCVLPVKALASITMLTAAVIALVATISSQSQVLVLALAQALIILRHLHHHLLQDQCGAHHLLDILDMDHGHVDHVTHITIIRIGNLVRID